jgi:predicted nucleic acid-binding protein
VELVVLDSSVGVKWVRRERGTEEARELLERHASGKVAIVVPVLFVHEVLDVTRRYRGVEKARALWGELRALDVRVAGIDDDLMHSALDLSGDLGCTLYDAMAPALAERLDAPLYSADRRAHGSLAYAEMVG